MVCFVSIFFFFKQKTAYEMRISDWSSDVCSSDLAIGRPHLMAMGNRTDAPGCLVEQAVNAALDTSFREAEALLLDRFEAVTLAALAADFHADRKSVV